MLSSSCGKNGIRRQNGRTTGRGARRAQRRFIREKERNRRQLVSGSKGEDRGCPESTLGKGAQEWRAEAERCQHAQEEDDVSRRPEEDCSSPTSAMGESEGCPEEVRVRDDWFAMGKFSPTKRHGDCEEIANPSTAYGRRRRNWIDAHGSVPPGQVVDASCGNKRCIALRHAYLRPRVEQPGKYRKIADRVHRLKVGHHFDVQGVGTDERSRNRFRSGLYAAARLDKVSVRGQPDGSVRVTKVGEWSSVRA